MKIIKYGFVTVFYLILLIFMVFTITGDREISDVEKRTLTTFPEFSISNLLTDEYYETLTEAFSDQLYLRDYLVQGYYLMQMQRYLGDVVIGEDDEMFAAVQSSKNMTNYASSLEEISSYINALGEELEEYGAEFIFLSIPRKDAVMTEYLPSTYTSSKDTYLYGVNVLKNNLSDKIHFVDAYDIFTSNEGKFYFKTDHHINVRGGELLYKEIMSIVSENYDVTAYELEDIYEINSVTVNGSFNKQIGQSGKLSTEELYLTLKIDLDYTRYENNEVSTEAIWGKGNTYEDAFMNGDKAFTRVETYRDELPNIMFVGASFTNILEALSVPSFNRMISIDYRHNDSATSIIDYVKEYDIDYVVFVPSKSTDGLSAGSIWLHLGL